MMEFLYFPEDKSEYIPAVLTLIAFIIAASVTMILIIRSSQKEEKKVKDHYQKPQDSDQSPHS